jgi:hypothetical protein
MNAESSNAATDLVFSAIAISEGAELSSIVAACDYLNRGGPTADQFETAVRQLLGLDLIEESLTLRFRLTPAGAELWAKTGERGEIERFLSVGPLIPAGPAEPWVLDRAAFDAAKAAYLDWFTNRSG